ncbi:hypothetical protein B0H13DRAFT_2342216 [Mycena leptocephala]|nr:hypothetical protein B0H13DRAFT_2342216 [Mycena leptocephala]
MLTCYNSGAKTGRSILLEKIDYWCGKIGESGITLRSGEESFRIKANGWSGASRLILSVEAINGCDLALKYMEGTCTYHLGRAVDECNSKDENGKQGGYVTTECAVWRIDPERY